MTRTVEVTSRAHVPYPDKRAACGFCSITPVRHDFCPGSIPNASNSAPDRVWHCACALNGHAN